MNGRMNGRVVRRVAVVGMAGALFGAACTSQPTGTGDGAAPPATTGPTWSRVDDPSLGLEAPAISVTGATTVDETDVVLVGSSTVADGAASTPAVWISEDGDDFDLVDDPAFDQSSAVATAADAGGSGGDALAVVGLDLDEGIHARAWIRDADGSWTTEPPEIADVESALLDDVAALDDGGFVAVGRGIRSNVLGVVVTQRSPDGTWTGALLDGSDESVPTSVVAHDDTVLITGYRRIAAGLDPTGWTSTDGGGTWTEIEAGAFGDVGTGRPITAAFVDDRFVAFGTNTDSTELAAWFSDDAVSWEPLDVSIDGDPIELQPEQAAVIDGVVVLPATRISGGPFPQAVALDPATGFDTNPYPDLPGELPPMGPGPITASADGLVLTVQVPRSVVVIREEQTEEFILPGDGPFPESDVFFRVNAIASHDDQLLIGGSEGPIGSSDHIHHDPLLWGGDPGSLTRGSVDDASNVTVVAAAPDGGFVVAGAMPGSENEDESTTDYNDLWIGTVDTDGTMTRTGTITGPGEPRVETLVYDGERWYLGGTERPDAQGADLFGAVWSSSDLETWTAEDGDFDDATVRGICTTGDGVIAVGTVSDEDRVAHPMAWTRASRGDWTAATDADGLPTARGAFTGCIEGDDGVTVIGHSDDVPIVLRTTDGSSFEASGFSGEEHTTVAAISRSTDGIVIAGADERGLIPRPILWTSTDGTTWQESVGPIPASGNPTTAMGMTFVGSQLYLVGDDGDAPALWSVTDLFGS